MIWAKTFVLQRPIHGEAQQQHALSAEAHLLAHQTRTHSSIVRGTLCHPRRNPSTQQRDPDRATISKVMTHLGLRSASPTPVDACLETCIATRRWLHQTQLSKHSVARLPFSPPERYEHADTGCSPEADETGHLRHPDQGPMQYAARTLWRAPAHPRLRPDTHGRLHWGPFPDSSKHQSFLLRVVLTGLNSVS
ncbi:hypothetical protein PhaeoP75_00185 [Phaeobacter gallaeciensis]|uniref:Uncharacterized protein n=1 Tax=Phaeobacter gallaeciensis TaxID=60890 RepID=A0AAC9Z672_9RHOB|nr:hypothetical protein Gal_00186 [Phaeobacter gallaeciensis DSM 26640]ATE95530.1 hypothetical protein PhaeoP73_00185 [Phaeobacter gallaeciensis]ATE99869.1 hypothetical protein PhaeoP75_00185 [Phaeobacter gallaeciensis]ATF04302.1 hypothetical protein PhaeoP63_00185 [Phaeobacter gallaeciensis]